jgi:cell pole-organizing protein PopZ
MAKEKEKDPNNTNSEDAVDNSPSMEDILKSIRGVISGDENPNEDEDILELTEMIEEGNPIEEQTNVLPDGKSVLDQIDEALKEDNEHVMLEKTEEQPLVFDEIEPQMPPQIDTPPPFVESLAIKEEEGSKLIDQINIKEDLIEITSNSLDIQKERLLQEKVAHESSETLKRLVENLPKSQVVSPYTAGGITLEQLTIEAMKPFLAEWLNKNLPTIVNQIVTKEIRKLIPDEEK